MSKIYIKGAPFRYKGALDVSDCYFAREVMQKAKLDFEVSKCEVVAKLPGGKNDWDRKDGFLFGGDFFIDCPNAYATYRTDLNVPLGMVKNKYTIVQNLEAFDFFDGAIGKNKAIWQTAGCFGNGERIFVSAKLPRNIYVNGDPVENYLVFTNSHDGSSGVKILFTPIRVICQNTLNAAIATSTNYVSFRHTQKVHDKIDLASEILGICDDKIRFLDQKYSQMNKVKMSDDAADKVFANLILNEKELDTIKSTGHTIKQIINRDWNAIADSHISMKKLNTITGIKDYYYNGIGQQTILGTGWGVYNAVTGYYSNIDNAEGEKRMDTLLYGDRSNKIKTTGDLIIAA